MQAFENMSKFYQSCAKPMAQLAELNIQSLTHLAEQTKAFHEALQKRDPEIFFNMQTHIMNNAITAASEYVRKFTEIQLNGINEMGKVWGTLCQDVASSIPAAGRPGSNAGSNTNRQSQK
ncbi:MAG: phasin family protein [Gammaproteobacteria bacterium]|nr:phasin family protein [Gammaproteobacteria bacterium]